MNVLLRRLAGPAVIILAALGAPAQEFAPGPSDRLLGVRPLGTVPVADSSVTLPTADVFDPSSFPAGFIRTQRFGVDPMLKAGNLRAQVRTGISARLSPVLPLLERGAVPQDAKLKLGPFYFDVGSLSAGMLYSDNVEQSEDDRDSGTIGVIAINDILLRLQMTENLRLAVRGDFIILPFVGKAGFNGFGIRDPLLMAGLNPQLFHAHAAYDFVLAGWDMTLADSFTIEDERLRRNLAASLDEDSDMLAEVEFDAVDEAGRYSYGYSSRSRRDRADEELENRYGRRRGLRYDNTASLSATRMLAADTRATLVVFQTNYWYSDDDDDTYSQPDWRRGISASLVSERPSIRFKPYALYTATQNSDSDGILQVARLGARGPITQNMRIDANAGLAHTPEWRGPEAVYAVTLTHQPRATTAHSLAIVRGVTGDEERPGIRDWVTYRIMQGLGPYLRATGSARWSKDRTDFDDDNDAAAWVGEEWGLAAGLEFKPGDRLLLSLREIYTESKLRGSTETEWITRLTAWYRLRDRVYLGASYEFTDLDSTAARQSYYENLVRVWMTVKL